LVQADKFSPEPIPTVEEMIDECLSLDLKMIIDLGSFAMWDSAEKSAKFVVDLFRKEPKLFEMAIVTSHW
jgi:hypothetical protein